ncbi:uridylyltransferase [Psychrobacter sp. JCM 18903]|nr:uridylyltransferase [Psychrobacter sp. JCM 18903]
MHAARITTLGERAEDMFYISDQNDEPLSAARLDALRSALMAVSVCKENSLLFTANVIEQMGLQDKSKINTQRVSSIHGTLCIF